MIIIAVVTEEMHGSHSTGTPVYDAYGSTSPFLLWPVPGIF